MIVQEMYVMVAIFALNSFTGRHTESVSIKLGLQFALQSTLGNKNF